MQPKSKRIIIDVNIWISYFIDKGIKTRFDKILNDSQFILLNSNVLETELFEVARRPKFKKLFDKQILAEFEHLYPLIVETVNVTSVVNVSPDPDDNYLLELAADGNADFLITGDKSDLLHLKFFENTQIISFSDFCSKFKI